MAPGSGPARWNPQSQQWERPQDPQRRGRRGSPEPEPPREPGAGPGPAREGPGPGRPGPPPKPAYAPGAEPPAAELPAAAEPSAAEPSAAEPADPEPPNPWAAPADPAPRRGPPAGRTARRWPRRLGVALGVAAAVGGAVWGASYLTGDSAQVPDGYKVLRSAGAGFRVAVPDDWQLSASESGGTIGTVFRPEQGRGRLLQVYRVTGGSDNACEVLIEDTKGLSSRDGYRRISLGATDTTGCEIVYELPDGETNGTAHAIGRLTVASDGSRWVLMGFGPVAETKAVRTRMAAALGSFRPD
ncbi:hypothetical protein AB0D97_07185 [Streptomyces roseus]|uniref:hypothetical protein n=1 Tax=Streptomyces roseus TaxID=66430 RepID=UPI003406CD95